ncbi:MAG: hypothetical protein ACKVX7_15505 [Planctomycetota bacterium]
MPVFLPQLGGILLITLAACAAHGVEVDLQRFIPADCYAVVEIPDGGQFVAAYDALRVDERLMRFPEYAAFLASAPGQQLRAGLRFLETRFECSFPAFAQRILNGPISIAAVASSRARPALLAIARPRDGKTVTEFLQIVAFANGVGTFQPNEGDIFRLGEFAGAWRDGLLWICSDEDVVRRSMSLREEDSLAKQPNHIAMSPVTTTRPLASVFVDCARTKTLPNIPLARLNERFAEPLPSLLFGGLRDTLVGASSLRAELRVAGDAVALEVVSNPLPPNAFAPGFFPVVTPSRSADSTLTELAAFSLRRDLVAWWEGRETLLLDSARAGVARFQVDFGNLTGGLDFAEDVLAHLLTDGRFLVFSPTVGAEPPPTPLLPYFAIVVPVRDGGTLYEHLRLAFQTAISFINLDRAPRVGAPRYFLESSEHHGTHLTLARPSPPDADAAPGLAHNFAPAISVCRDHLIFASHEHAARALIDQLLKETEGETRATNELRVAAQPLAELLKRNLTPLTAQGVLEGKSVEKARSDLIALVTLIEFFRELRVAADRTPDDRLALTLRLSIAPPASSRESF